MSSFNQPFSEDIIYSLLFGGVDSLQFWWCGVTAAALTKDGYSPSSFQNPPTLEASNLGGMKVGFLLEPTEVLPRKKWL